MRCQRQALPSRHKQQAIYELLHIHPKIIMHRAFDFYSQRIYSYLR